MYNNMDIRSLVNAQRAHYKELFDKEISAWKRLRHISLLYYNSQVKPQNAITNEVDYMPLPGEKKTKPVTLSPETVKKIFS